MKPCNASISNVAESVITLLLSARHQKIKRPNRDYFWGKNRQNLLTKLYANYAVCPGKRGCFLQKPEPHAKIPIFTEPWCDPATTVNPLWYSLRWRFSDLISQIHEYKIWVAYLDFVSIAWRLGRNCDVFRRVECVWNWISNQVYTLICDRFPREELNNWQTN